MKTITYTTKIKKFVKKVIWGAAISCFSLSSLAQTHTDKVHLGILYPISTHGTHAPLDTNTFSFHLLGGVSAEEQGLAFNGFSGVVKNNVTGIMFSGFSNHVGKTAKGLLFAGFANTYRESKGMQFAGFANIASGNAEGGQFAGFLNTSWDLKGSQFAGFSNTAKNAIGAQFAGFINTAESVQGSQFGGFANLSASSVSGNQVAGFINVAKEVSGSQVAGFINVAKKVKGIQVAGFINIADSSDHPVAIINIIKNGQKSIGFSMDETETALLSFRSGGKVLYGIIGAGYNFRNEEEVYAFEAGLGGHFLKSKHFELNTELSTQYIEGFNPGEYFKSSLRLMPSLRLGQNVALFAGPTLNYINTNTFEGKNLVDYYLWEKQNQWDNNFRALYIGYLAGINIIF